MTGLEIGTDEYGQLLDDALAELHAAIVAARASIARARSRAADGRLADRWELTPAGALVLHDEPPARAGLFGCVCGSFAGGPSDGCECACHPDPVGELRDDEPASVYDHPDADSAPVSDWLP